MSASAPTAEVEADGLDIPVLSNQHTNPPIALIHDFNTFYALRSEHRLLGVLTGTLPSMPGQNVFLGLPYLLMTEEAEILRQNGVARLVAEANSYDEPTKEQIEISERKRSEDIEDHKKRTREIQVAKKVEFLKAHPDIANKMKVSPKSTPSKAKGKQNHSTSGSHLYFDESPAAEGRTEPDDDFLYRLVVPSATTVEKMPWYSPRVLDSNDTASPRSLFDRARLGIYKDLYSQGYWPSSGLKFGGDFVAYPGDPLRYHSHFICTVHPKLQDSEGDEEEDPITALDIVAWGRLATGVKKNHLICGWDEEKGEAEYFTVNWAGYG
ncbi:tRNA-intron endonuclease catalytic domain-like protein [Atractiella rhizophila]|nr:tRNA-intron endonuclease catalytic domain-like protein [Atractiella rhizophila]